MHFLNEFLYAIAPLRRYAFLSSSIHHILLKSLLHHILLINGIFELFNGLSLPFGYRHYSGGSPDRISPETLPDPVHCHIKADLFRSIVKHVKLLNSSHHMTEPYTNKSYKHTSLVEFCKEFFGDIGKNMVE